MKKFEGNKLLVLGSNVGSVDIVNYARSNGAYVIVADYLEPNQSPAKLVANEHVLISTSDIEKLKALVIEKKIDGVFAGISEFNLIQAMKICNYFNFPFYCNEKQWNLIENKGAFRELCIKYSVPTPSTYFIGDKIEDIDLNKIQYPIVVKPVDSSASIGVSICQNKDELKKYAFEALKVSESGKIIIEEYCVGDEFTAHYTIANTKITLSSIDNRYPVSVNSGMVTTIPIARVYPSLFYESYMKQVNKFILNLCESLNLKNGVFFVQGLYNRKNNKFSIFEAGLRCAGEAPFRFIEKINGVNLMNNLVDHSFGVASNFDSVSDDPLLKGKKSAIVSFVSKGGKIGEIKGLEEAIKDLDSIYSYECRYKEGDITPSGNTLRQILLRFVLINDTIEDMINTIQILNNNIMVLNDRHEDMCLKFNPSRLLTEFM